MARLFKRGSTFWGDFNADGVRVRRSTGCTDKTAAQATLAKWIREAEYVKAGLMPVDPAHRDRDWSAHLADWLAWLKDNGRDARYIAQARRDATRSAQAQGWTKLRDMTAEAIDGHLRGLLTTHAAHTVNNRRAYLHAFGQWCVDRKRLVENPCQTAPFDLRGATRRRPLKLDELRRLLACPQIPDDRRRAYSFLTLTGLRAAEAGGVIAGMIDLDAPALHLPGSLTKSGEDETIPLHTQAVQVIRDQMAARPTTGALFTIPRNRRFVADLHLAGIVPTDPRGRVCVLHSLRHTHNALLAAAGVSGTMRMRLMRQRDVKLAEGTYLDPDALPLAGALDRLPDLLTG